MFTHRSRREQLALYALAGLFILAMAYVGAGRMRQPAPLSIQSVPYEKTAASPASVRQSQPKRTPAPASAPTTTDEVVVDVGGAVKRPGVLHLRSGARVDDAIRGAGGPTQAADLDRINRADILIDRDHIVVPKRAESNPTAVAPIHGRILPSATVTPVSPPAPSVTLTPVSRDSATPPIAAPDKSSSRRHSKMPSEPVSLNTATIDQLETLPGVGPSTAQKILDYRTSHGQFTSLQELAAIKGLGPKKLEKILPYVKL